MGITSQAALELVLRARDEAEATVRRFNDVLGETEETTEKATNSTKGFDLAVEAAMVTGMIAAAAKVAQVTYEVGRLSAENERTTKRFEAFSGSSAAAASNLEALQVATKGAVDEQTLMTEGAVLLQTGLAKDSDEMARLVRMATTLGKSSETAQEKISNFNLMLLNTSIPRLDSYGLSGAKARARIAELQASVEGLSREEAFKIAVMEQGNEAMARLGDVTEDTLLTYEQFEASAKDLKAALIEDVGGALEYDIQRLTMAMNTVKLLINWDEKLTAVVEEQSAVVYDSADSYIVYASGVLQAANAAGIGLDEITEAGILLTETQFLARKAGDEWADSMERVDGRLSQMGHSANVTESELTGLAAASSKVAKNFGKMKFDNKELWNMALASGASAEALAALAIELDIATEAEIANTVAAAELIEEFERGEISAEDLSVAFDGLESNTQQAADQMRRADDAAKDLRQRTGEAVGPIGEMAGALGASAAEAARLAAEANAAALAVERLNRAAVGTGEQEFDVGPTGIPGVGIVPPANGEGGIIVPVGEGEGRRERGEGRGDVIISETVVIQDTASMAMFLESRTEAGLRSLSDSVMG